MFFSIWYKVGLLALESSEVIQLRICRITAGGPSAIRESVLMVQEKVEAACETGFNLTAGGSLLSVVDRYRGYVAANVERLKAISPHA